MAASMMFFLHICAFAAAAAAATQQCYYPNGDAANTDIACSLDEGVCCPYQWTCMDNGLCYLENEQLFGRYTCTDQSWRSESCPQICTANNTASGNEALLQCSDGSWCCDGDRSFDCCARSDTVFFNLPNKSSVAHAPETSKSASEPSSPTDATSSGRLSVPETASIGSVTTNRITATGPSGSVSTIVSVITISSIQPVPTSASTSNLSRSSATGEITTALAVSLPIGALFLVSGGVLLCLCRRRRYHRLQHLSTAPSMSSPSSAALSTRTEPNPARRYTGLFGPKRDKHASPKTLANLLARPEFKYAWGHSPPEGRTAEIDSHPIAQTHPADSCKSELDTNPTSFANTTPSSSAPGHGGYGAGSGPSSVTEAPRPQTLTTPQTLRSVNEDDPAEVWGGYVPYRPSPTALRAVSMLDGTQDESSSTGAARKET